MVKVNKLKVNELNILTYDNLIPWKRDLRGDAFIINARSYYKEEEITALHQLYVGGSGFGSEIGKSGTKLYCHECLTDSSEVLSRRDVLGLLPYDIAFDIFENPYELTTFKLAFNLIQDRIGVMQREVRSWEHLKELLLISFPVDIIKPKLTVSQVKDLKELDYRLSIDEPEFHKLFKEGYPQDIESMLNISGTFKEMFDRVCHNSPINHKDAELAYIIRKTIKADVVNGEVKTFKDSPLKTVEYLESLNNLSGELLDMYREKLQAVREDFEEQVKVSNDHDTLIKYVKHKQLEGYIQSYSNYNEPLPILLVSKYLEQIEELGLEEPINIHELNLYKSLQMVRERIKALTKDQDLFGPSITTRPSNGLLKSFIQSYGIIKGRKYVKVIQYAIKALPPLFEKENALAYELRELIPILEDLEVDNPQFKDTRIGLQKFLSNDLKKSEFGSYTYTVNGILEGKYDDHILQTNEV